jgi:cell wall-associated NlpC family hydrolase
MSNVTVSPLHLSFRAVVSIAEIQAALRTGHAPEYQCQANLNLYDSPTLEQLATQAVARRQLQILPLPPDSDGIVTGAAIRVRLCEDDYPGWLPLEDLDLIDVAETPYQPINLSEAAIKTRLPQAIAYTYTAMAQPNHYLWGGTVGPNYDCSGLVQTAFAAVGIWLPRDAYQQEGFVQPIDLKDMDPGDLVFFGPNERATHVGLYLGEGYYIHSSGRDRGRNGIGIDPLSDQGDEVSRAYYQQLRGAGRVVAGYQPKQ